MLLALKQILCLIFWQTIFLIFASIQILSIIEYQIILSHRFRNENTFVIMFWEKCITFYILIDLSLVRISTIVNCLLEYF
jgi:hypothetical protein